MDFHVIIPARYGATRLPGKPLLEIGGKPMIEWVYERAREAEARQVVVATDDVRVRDAVQAFGGMACMTSATHRSGTDRIAETATLLNLKDDTLIVNVQGDEPLIPAPLIRQVAQTLQENPAAAMATAAYPIADAADFNDPNIVKVVRDSNGNAMYFSRAPIPWPRTSAGRYSSDSHIALRHIGIYAYRAGFVREFSTWPACDPEEAEALEQLRALWHGKKIAVCVAHEEPGHGVDSQEDLARIRRELDS